MNYLIMTGWFEPYEYLVQHQRFDDSEFSMDVRKAKVMRDMNECNFYLIALRDYYPDSTFVSIPNPYYIEPRL